MSGPSRGECTIHIGGEERTLTFNTDSIIAIEDALQMEVMAYLGARKSPLRFLQVTIFCGLSKQGGKKLNPQRVSRWLAEYEGNIEDLQKEILYGIAKGQPAQTARDMCQALDDIFNETAGEPGPLSEGSSGPTGESVESERPPQSA